MSSEECCLCRGHDLPITPAECAAALDDFLANQHELGFVIEDIRFNTSAEPLKKASKRRAFKCGTFPVTVR